MIPRCRSYILMPMFPREIPSHFCHTVRSSDQAYSVLCRISADIFNVLQFVHFKGCFIIRDHITYSDLIDAETEKRKVLRAGYHDLRYCWDIWRLSQIRQLLGSQLKCEICS